MLQVQSRNIYNNYILYFAAEFCPPLADPLGGYQSCRDWGAGGQFKVCEIACRDSLRFSQPVPPFYTCGAEGFWRPTANPSLPLVYPACSRKILFIACSFIPIYLSIVHQKFNDYFVLQRLHQLNESSKFLCYSRALFFATTPDRLCFVRRFAALSTN